MRRCIKSHIEALEKVLSLRERKAIESPQLTRAAVLVPLFNKNDECHILFTKRTQHVKHHKGQISFPGGVFDKCDGSLEETALRESFEEIGLLEKDTRIIGMLDDIVTVTGFIVTPFVGTIPYPYPFRVSQIEIEELIEVPLKHLLDGRHFSESIIDDEYGTRQIYTYMYQDHAIWGATALILKQLLDIVLFVESEAGEDSK